MRRPLANCHRGAVFFSMLLCAKRIFHDYGSLHLVPLEFARPGIFRSWKRFWPLVERALCRVQYIFNSSILLGTVVGVVMLIVHDITFRVRYVCRPHPPKGPNPSISSATVPPKPIEVVSASVATPVDDKRQDKKQFPMSPKRSLH